MKISQLYEAKALDKIPVCPQERLVIISNTTGLSFAIKRIGPLTAIIIIVFYFLVLYYSALSITSKNLFASICSDSLIKTACQHLLLLVGFDTLIYQKYFDTPPILVGHQSCHLKKKALVKKQKGKRPQVQGHAQPRVVERSLPKKNQANAPIVEKSSEKKVKKRTCYICREKGHALWVTPPTLS
jgi:hypothetical protein